MLIAFTRSPAATARTISSRSSGFNSRFIKKCKGFPTNSVVLLAGQEIIRNATAPDDENNPAPPASLVSFARDGLAAQGTGGQLQVYGVQRHLRSAATATRAGHRIRFTRVHRDRRKQGR